MRFFFLSVLLPLVAACLCAAFAWILSTNKRRASRAIDLASHTFAIVGLMWSLTTMTHYETKLSDAFNRMSLNSQSIDMEFDAVAKMNEICDRSPTTDVRRKDCSKLGRYFVPIRDGVGARTEVPFPPLNESEYADPQIRTFVATLSQQFKDFNTSQQAQHRSGLTADDFSEYHIFSLVVELLSFAFGLGLMRRALDLYNDW